MVLTTEVKTGIIPAPTAAKPTPNTTRESPSKEIDPLKDTKEGINGFNNFAAVPIIRSAPAIAANPIATPPHPRPEIIDIALANAKRAEAATNKDKAAGILFCILLSARLNNSSDTPMPTNPAANSPKDNLPIVLITLAMSNSADATDGRTTLISIKPVLGIALDAIDTASKEPAIAARPLAIPSQLNFEKINSDFSRIRTDVATTTRIAPVFNKPLAFFIKIENMDNSPRIAPIVVKPLAIPSQLMLLKSEQTSAKILIAPLRITIPSALVIAFLPNFALFIKIDTEPINVPTLIRPLAICSQDNAAKYVHAVANILIAVANTTICKAPLIVLLLFVAKAFEAKTTIVVSPRTPIIPFSI